MTHVAESHPTVDWTAVQRSPEFQELVRDRRRFVTAAGTLGVGAGATYVLVANLARDLMGSQVIGSISLGFLGGVALILLTWAITWTYMRRSQRVWGPMEERVRALATGTEHRTRTGRFTPSGRTADPTGSPARDEVTR